MASQEFTPIYKPGSGGRWDVQIMHILERFISAVVWGATYGERGELNSF